MESQNQTTLLQTTPQVSYQSSGDPRGLTKPNLTEFSGDPLDTEILKMAGKRADKHWITTEYRMSGQFPKLEIETF